jgi:hypothetical protein
VRSRPTWPWLYNQLGANLTGLLLFALALGLWKTVGTSLSARIGVIAFGVFAVGTFLDGLFRLDCRKIDGCDRMASWHATAHVIETTFTVIGVFVAVFVLARAFKTSARWHDLWVATLAAGIVALASLALLSLLGGGLAVRVATTILFAWVALVSYRLLRIAQAKPMQLREPS